MTEDIETMLAERECEGLVYRYAWFVDSGEASAIGDLFVEEGTWAAGGGAPMRGRDAIRAGFAARQAVGRRQSRHVMTNVLVEMTGPDTAVGRAYLVNFRHDSPTGVAEKPAPADVPKYVGEYHLTFRRVDGSWLFSTLELDLAFIRGPRVNSSVEA
jgi:hypothetical protein